MKENHVYHEAHQILNFFQISYEFGSLFVFSNGVRGFSAVCQIKNINSGLNEISFIKVGDDDLPFENNSTINAVNDSDNIFFISSVIRNHGNKMITISIPSKLTLKNLRRHHRYSIPQERLGIIPELTSYGPDGIRKLMSFEGKLVDISQSGASFEIETSILTGFFRGDIVELKASEKYSYLNKLMGVIVHKTISELTKKTLRRYRLGIQFKKEIDLSPIISF